MQSAADLEVGPLSRLFRALADETRIRIVGLLAHDELCVCHVEAALGISQPNASRQLAILRSAGIVEPRREGNWVYYGLARQGDEVVRKLLREIVRNFEGQEQLGRDLERLIRVRGPRSCA